MGDASDIEGYDRKRSGLSNAPPHMKQDNDGIRIYIHSPKPKTNIYIHTYIPTNEAFVFTNATIIT